MCTRYHKCTIRTTTEAVFVMYIDGNHKEALKIVMLATIYIIITHCCVGVAREVWLDGSPTWAVVVMENDTGLMHGMKWSVPYGTIHARLMSLFTRRHKGKACTFFVRQETDDRKVSGPWCDVMCLVFGVERWQCGHWTSRVSGSRAIRSPSLLLLLKENVQQTRKQVVYGGAVVR